MYKNFTVFAAIVLFVNSIVPIGACLYLPAMPIIAKSMGLGEADIGRTITYYFLAFSFFSFIAGYLSDALGRKIVIICGIFFYLIGSIICGISACLNLLIGGRIVQALGASMIPGAITAMIRDVGDDIQVISILGWNSVIGSIFLVGAPIIGGFITQHYGWRGNFWFLVVFCLIVTVISFIYLNETIDKKKKLNIAPVIKIYLKMLVSPYYIFVLLPFILCFAIQGAYFTASPFIFIKKFGFSPIEFGFSNIIIVLGLFIGRFFSVFITEHFSSRKAYISGSFIIIISAVIFFAELMLNLNSLYITFLAIGIFATGFGCLSPIAMQSSITAFRNYSGMAGALQGSLILIMSAIGSAFTVILAKFYYNIDMFKIFIFLILFFSFFIFITSLISVRYLFNSSTPNL